LRQGRTTSCGHFRDDGVAGFLHAESNAREDELLLEAEIERIQLEIERKRAALESSEAKLKRLLTVKRLNALDYQEAA